MPAQVNQPTFTLPPAAECVEVSPLQHSLPLLTLYSRHCPLPTIMWGFRFPFAISLSLSIFFPFLTAALFALWTLTPENSPSSPGELHGYAHLGTAAIVGLCLGIVCG